MWRCVGLGGQLFVSSTFLLHLFVFLWTVTFVCRWDEVPQVHCDSAFFRVRRSSRDLGRLCSEREAVTVRPFLCVLLCFFSIFLRCYCGVNGYLETAPHAEMDLKPNWARPRIKPVQNEMCKILSRRSVAHYSIVNGNKKRKDGTVTCRPPLPRKKEPLGTKRRWRCCTPKKTTAAANVCQDIDCTEQLTAPGTTNR